MSGLDLGPQPWIVGHRGAAGSALENSPAAVRAGIAEGAAMIEIDVQLTSDLVPVVFHDWDLRRLAGRSELVERTSLEQLNEIEIESPFEDDQATIVTLSDMLQHLPESLPLNLELKRRFHGFSEFVDAFAPFFNLERPLLVSSFDWTLLARLRRAFPHLPLAPIGRFKATALLEAAAELRAFSIHPHRELAPQLFEPELDQSLPVIAYTVNDAEEAVRLREMGTAGFFTDRPAGLREDLVNRG